MTPRNAPAFPLAAALCLSALVAVARPGSLFAGSTLVANSPFAPAGVVAGPGAGPAEAYELAGSTVQGSDISICIFERQKKHSQWIPVGGDADGIHVVSFDAAHDTAVVTVSGVRKDLSMRKAVIASNSPTMVVGRGLQPAIAPTDLDRANAPVPIASAPAQPAVQDQKEARMLVSDLLEIGVQQRKAYQEAKLKAAQSPQPSQ